MSETACPYCAEPIGPDADKCRSCGERLGDDPIAPTVQTGSARTVIVIVLGILFVAAIVCILPFFFMIRAAPVPPPMVGPGPNTPVLPPDPGTATVQQVQGLAMTPPAFVEINGTTTATLSFYSWGGFAIMDMGSVRVIVRGTTYRGTTSSVVIIRQTAFMAGGVSSSSFGSHEFKTRTKDGVTTGTWDQLDFDIDDGILMLTKSGLTAEIEGPPQCIVVDPDGSNAQKLPYTGP